MLIRDQALIRDERNRPRTAVLYFHGGHESAVTAPASAGTDHFFLMPAHCCADLTFGPKMGIC